MKIKSILFVLLWTPAWLWAAPMIQHWQTGNGARVYFVEARELPMVDAQVVFDAGGARDGDSPGLARLTNGMLAEGARGLNADEIAERFAELGAEFGNSSLRDMAIVELRSLSEPKRLDAAVSLLARLVGSPNFPTQALERVRRQMLVGLQGERQSPGSIGKRAYYAELYKEHPYGSWPAGTEASVTALTADAVAGFHQRYYVGKNAVVAIVGDLDRAGAEKVAEHLVGTLPAGHAAPPTAQVKPLKRGENRIIHHPSSQTHLLMGQPGISRQDPDFYALYTGNHVLGGSGLVSLLSKEVREKRGLSYSVYSYFQPMRAAGPFTLGLQTKNEQAHQALEVARTTLRDFIRDGPTEKALQAAKRNITGGFPLRIDSNSKIVGYLSVIGFYQLPLDYLTRFTTRIEAVTRDGVRDTFRRRIDPERMITILVGQVAAE
ncbi:MAG: insulinase family protein [Gammaproteobacteria bacterium]|nr:insulinase family protein [Gammaproteobacteria bacterium]